MEARITCCWRSRMGVFRPVWQTIHILSRDTDAGSGQHINSAASDSAEEVVRLLQKSTCLVQVSHLCAEHSCEPQLAGASLHASACRDAKEHLELIGYVLCRIIPAQKALQAVQGAIAGPSTQGSKPDCFVSFCLISSCVSLPNASLSLTDTVWCQGHSADACCGRFSIQAHYGRQQRLL